MTHIHNYSKVMIDGKRHFKCLNCGDLIPLENPTPTTHDIEKKMDDIFEQWKTEPGGTDFGEIKLMVERFKTLTRSAMAHTEEEVIRQVLECIGELEVLNKDDDRPRYVDGIDKWGEDYANVVNSQIIGRNQMRVRIRQALTNLREMK